MSDESLGYSALDIAKWFINATDRGAGDDITHLKVQKLLYYAQGWALVYFKKPLFAEELEAWAHGPVAPSIYNYFRSYGFNSIPEQKITRKVSGDVADLLDAVNEKYGIYTAKRLERMTTKQVITDPGLFWKAHKGSPSNGFSRPSQLSKEITLCELRVSGGSRVHGALMDDTFFLVWLDRNHDVFPER